MILTGRRQHRILTAMHDSLRTSDPRLVATFAAFTKLTRDEAIPSVERVKSEPVRWVTSASHHVAGRWRGIRRHGIRRHGIRRRGIRRHGAADRREPVTARRRGPAAAGSRPVIVRGRVQGALFIPLLAVALLAIVLLLGQGNARGSCPPARVAVAGNTHRQAVPPRQYAVGGVCPASQTQIIAPTGRLAAGALVPGLPRLTSRGGPPSAA